MTQAIGPIDAALPRSSTNRKHRSAPPQCVEIKITGKEPCYLPLTYKNKSDLSLFQKHKYIVINSECMVNIQKAKKGMLLSTAEIKEVCKQLQERDSIDDEIVSLSLENLKMGSTLLKKSAKQIEIDRLYHITYQLPIDEKTLTKLVSKVMAFRSSWVAKELDLYFHADDQIPLSQQYIHKDDGKGRWFVSCNKVHSLKHPLLGSGSTNRVRTGFEYDTGIETVKSTRYLTALPDRTVFNTEIHIKQDLLQEDFEFAYHKGKRVRASTNQRHIHAAKKRPEKEEYLIDKATVYEKRFKRNLRTWFEDELTATRDDLIHLKLYPICLSLLENLVKLHDLEIFHRDIKPENIDAETWKLIDFDLALDLTQADFRRCSKGGSWGYGAPEILMADKNDTRAIIFANNLPADIWSMGATLFELFFQSTLYFDDFYEYDIELIYLLIVARKNNPSWLQERIKELTHPTQADRLISGMPMPSPDMIDLLDKMLNYDTQTRITAQQALTEMRQIAGQGDSPDISDRSGSV